MSKNILFGSICLSDIPKSQIKKIVTKNGEKLFLNVTIVPRKEPSQFGSTHFIRCSLKKEEQQDGVNYIFGDLTEYSPQPQITPETIEQAPAISEEDELPF